MRRTPIAGKSGRACLGKTRPRPGGVKSVQGTDLRVERARKPSRPGPRVFRACRGRQARPDLTRVKSSKPEPQRKGMASDSVKI